MMKPNTGRVLSAGGAVLLLISLALIWYHVDRPTGQQSWTGCLLVFLTMMAALLLVIMLLRRLGLMG